MAGQSVSTQHGKHRHVSKNTVTPSRVRFGRAGVSIKQPQENTPTARDTMCKEKRGFFGKVKDFLFGRRVK
jgi:hypothetical protein